MRRAKDSRSNGKSALRDFKVYRANRKLSTGDVSVHDDAAATFSLWKDLRRQFPPHSLLKPEIGSLLRGHVPMQAIKVRDRWHIFGGFETYTELQSLPTPTTKIRVEIQQFKKISRDEIEYLSLALLLHKVEMYSLCGSVAEEQLRTRLTTGFSTAARKAVLSCNTSSQSVFASWLGKSVHLLKRQAVRLKPKPTPAADFLSDILAETTHEKDD